MLSWTENTGCALELFGLHRGCNRTEAGEQLSTAAAPSYPRAERRGILKSWVNSLRTKKHLICHDKQPLGRRLAGPWGKTEGTVRLMEVGYYPIIGQ